MEAVDATGSAAEATGAVFTVPSPVAWPVGALKANWFAETALGESNAALSLGIAAGAG